MAHYFDVTPETPSEPSYAEGHFLGRDYRFITDHGVFSRGHIDTGTKVLLDAVLEDLRESNAKLPGPPRLLDLACGYGVLGIVLKRSFPAYHLTLTDVNERAIELTQKNLITHQVMAADVYQSDGISQLSLDPFSVIVCNPPIRTGKPTVHRLIEEAKEHLMPGGLLFTVFGKKQGAESYGRYLNEQFETTDRIAREQGFYVYRSQTKG